MPELYRSKLVILIMQVQKIIKWAGKWGLLNRTRTATILAVIMHGAGALGILYGKRDWFLFLTPFNLLVMILLLGWTLPEKNKRLYIFFAFALLIGLSTEMIGVKTGLLFGHYRYGDTLGLRVMGVPVLIGINWFIVVYACGMAVIQLKNFLHQQFQFQQRAFYSQWIGSSIIINGAVLATLFDYIMEPAAVKLGFWTWNNGNVPMMNYFTWFLVSMVILFVFRNASLKNHPFAINLLIIQAIFFLLLRY